ncbi:MAG: malto-oligosyltrehalose synthase [Nitriliruptorales bacterium]|nr:malto-oligosyltrehalose synthase [Nitriliruptorales bacterium]
MAPRATYRLQLRPHGSSFQHVAGMLDFLGSLGVSHVYLSPILQAAPGSAHGYDVTDPTRLSEDLGGAAGFDELVAAADEHGLGLVVDVVPNHLGLVSPHNQWWWDVLRHGPDSEYADHFDIAWRRSRDGVPYVLVPELGRELIEEITEGRDLRLAQRDGELRVAYHEHEWPLRPGTLEEVGLPADDPAAAVTAITGDRGRLLTLLTHQHYRLAHWRRANEELNYRRFFDVSRLGGLRVEDPAVFEATHARILELVDSGAVDGLRVDHPDGLTDPTGYIQRLRAAAPRAWIILEKILEPGESPRTDWPVDGTVGYEFCNLVLGLFVDPDAEPVLDELYASWVEDRRRYVDQVDDAKREVLDDLLRAEFGRLVDLLCRVGDDAGVVADRSELAATLADVLVSFPVYRTYVRPAHGTVEAIDQRYVGDAVARARTRRDGQDDVLDLIRDVLLLEQGSDASVEFVHRFQQLTGPLMAKGVEDTVFYRFLRFVAANEVGGAPARLGRSVGEFHEANARRQRDWPTSMLTTSTHDTKRSEDVRARLAVLSEMPDTWVRIVEEWREIAAPLRRGSGPSANHEYLLYQTLVGTWPIAEERLVDYLVKAAREEKRHTSWLEVDEAYEADLAGFVERLLNDEAFRGSVERFHHDVVEPGWLTSLSQTLLKLTSPGVPDVYQGCELWDASLVDPDNRRPVDFGRRRRLLGELSAGMHPPEILARMGEGLPKLWVTHRALAVRAEHPDAFGRGGSYEPLYARGPRQEHVVAFLRGDAVATVAPRLVVGLGGDFMSWDWEGTVLELPEGRWRDAFTGDLHDGGRPELERLLVDFPVALLVRQS